MKSNEKNSSQYVREEMIREKWLIKNLWKSLISEV